MLISLQRCAPVTGHLRHDGVRHALRQQNGWSQMPEVVDVQVLKTSHPAALHKSIPNVPTAMMLSAIMMLRPIGRETPAARIEQAIHTVFAQGRTLTPDAGGTASTEEFTDAVIAALR